MSVEQGRPARGNFQTVEFFQEKTRRPRPRRTTNRGPASQADPPRPRSTSSKKLSRKSGFFRKRDWGGGGVGVHRHTPARPPTLQNIGFGSSQRVGATRPGGQAPSGLPDWDELRPKIAVAFHNEKQQFWLINSKNLPYGILEYYIYSSNLSVGYQSNSQQELHMCLQSVPS